ncbi:MAG: hypothetical protein NTZ39_00040 [Methanoregula sp.]|nr:hypothetical protein [Methanoregula sp.]
MSGTAGTGQEHGIETGRLGKTEEKNSHATHERVVIGLGVLYNGKIPPCTIPDAAQDPVTSLEVAESNGDLIFSLFEREDRIRDRRERERLSSFSRLLFILKESLCNGHVTGWRDHPAVLIFHYG